MAKLQYAQRDLQTTGGYGIYLYWSASIDGVERWPTAGPFTAQQSQLILNECLECGQCSDWGVLARRIGEQNVIWLGRHEKDYLADLPRGDAILFDLEAYTDALPSGDAWHLLEPSNEEIRDELIGQDVPNYRIAIYRDFESEFDPQGDIWLRAIAECLARLDHSVMVCDAPAEPLTIEIGLELPGVPEHRAKFGLVDGELAVLLESRPRFPAWIRCDCFGPILSEYYRDWLQAAKQ